MVDAVERHSVFIWHLAFGIWHLAFHSRVSLFSLSMTALRLDSRQSTVDRQPDGGRGTATCNVHIEDEIENDPKNN
jgi:hypothetical protein